MPIENVLPQGRSAADSEIQTAILCRAAIYVTACSLYFAITLICTQWMNEPDRGLVDCLLKSAEDVSYWMPGFLLLLPIAAHDLIKLTSQFTKPVVQLREEMLRLVENRSERPLAVDENDGWYELTRAFNRIRGELLQLRKRLGELDVEADLPPSLMQDDEPILTTPAKIPVDQEVVAASNSPAQGISDDKTSNSVDDGQDLEETVRLAAPPVVPLPANLGSVGATLSSDVATA